MKLTDGQRATLKHVTAEPQRTAKIARAAGIQTHAATSTLLALRQKGLVVKQLNPTLWRLP